MPRLFDKQLGIPGNHVRAVVDLEEPQQDDLLRVRGYVERSSEPFGPDTPPGAAGSQRVEFTFELNCQNGRGSFVFNGRRMEINLEVMLQGRAAEEVVEQIMDLFEADMISRLTGIVPIGDPFLGCLLKGVATALVGQTVRCYDRTRGITGGFQRCRAIADCIWANAGWIAAKATVRFGGCLIMA